MANRLIRRLIPLVCATLLALAVPRPGQAQVLVVQGGANEVYQQAVSGFFQTFTATVSLPGVASVQPTETVVLDPASPDTVQLITQKHQSLQPKLIVAVGALALKSVASLPGPVIYLLVPDPQAISRPGASGVLMTVAPERQFAAIKETFPARARIGLLYNPTTPGSFPKLAHAAAGAAGLTLVSIPAGSDREAIRAVIEGAATIDALLLTPDPSLVSPTLLDALALFSLEKKIPLIGFAPKYLEQGAAMAVFASPEAMGRQAGRMALERMNRPRPDPGPPEYAKDATVLTNPRVIQKLGVSAVSSTNHGRLSP